MNNLNKKIVSIVFALALVVGGINQPQVAAAKKLTLSKVNLTLQVGSSATLTVKGVKGKLKWTSSKPKVAKVTKKGKITAKKVGKAVIKVKVKKKVFKCKVTVKKAKTSKVTTSPKATTKPISAPVVTSTPKPSTTTTSQTKSTATPTSTPTSAASKLGSNWSQDSENAKKLVNYVEDVTNTASKNFIPKKDRIAVFDMDGTLMCETYPTYYDIAMFVDYVLYDHPENMTEETTTIAKNLEGKTAAELTKYTTEEVAQAFAQAYKGLTVNELYNYTQEFGEKYVNRFNNLKYKDAFYRPMIEVVKYLYENDFTIYVVSGTERTTTRAIVANSPLAEYVNENNVIGTELEIRVKDHEAEQLTSTYQYNPGDELVYTGNFTMKNVQASKVLNISQEIGKQPVLSFGNSSGDISMANYTISGNKYQAQAYMLVADDSEREWGDAANWEKLSAKYTGLNLNSISMKNEFKNIYADNVTIKAN